MLSHASSWEALQEVFQDVSQDRVDDLFEQIKQADEFFDKDDEFGIRAVDSPNGELIVELTEGITWQVLAGRNRQQIGLPPWSLSYDEFDRLAIELIGDLPQNQPEIPRLILGRDNVVTISSEYPTIPGVLDVHVHGGYVDGEFMVQINREDGTARIQLTPYQFADIIRTNHVYNQAHTVRVFCCHGNGGGEEIAQLLNKNVITSTDEIHVNPNTGRMRMFNGTLVKYTTE